jgi:hypothetical protein
MITLKTKDGSKTGNAIIYGGEDPMDSLASLQARTFNGVCDEPKPLFFVETDFGNHMKLSWTEIEEMFTIGQTMDYSFWHAKRAELHEQKPYDNLPTRNRA